MLIYFFFFFNDTATTEIYTLSLHDALPICVPLLSPDFSGCLNGHRLGLPKVGLGLLEESSVLGAGKDRKSTRLNSSHANISYAVFCLKKKKQRCRETKMKSR